MAFRIRESDDPDYDYILRGTSDEEDPLDGGVDKWRTLAEFLAENPDAMVDDGGIRTCPLCTRYWYSGCVGCVVAGLSGEPFCKNTPYEDWEDCGGLWSAKEMLELLLGLKEDR